MTAKHATTSSTAAGMTRTCLRHVWKAAGSACVATLLCCHAAPPAWSMPVAAARGAAMEVDAAGCRLLVPYGFGRGSMRWIGACPGGMADGYGVIRVDAGYGVVEMFYGRMARGRPIIGYMEADDRNEGGSIASFRGAMPAGGGGEKGRLQVCAAAARAADVAAVRYRAAGNAATSRLHQEQARMFRVCDPLMGD